MVDMQSSVEKFSKKGRKSKKALELDNSVPLIYVPEISPEKNPLQQP